MWWRSPWASLTSTRRKHPQCGQGGPRQGLHPTTPPWRAYRAARGHCAEAEGREQPPLPGRLHRARQRHQAGDRQRHPVGRESRRRGHHPRPLLGLLRGHGAACRRHAGGPALDHRRGLQGACRADRRRRHAALQAHHRELALQSHRRGLDAVRTGEDRGHRGRPSAAHGALGRDLRIHPVRRRDDLLRLAARHAGAHHHAQRLRQGLRHDRLAPGLCRRRRAHRQGHGAHAEHRLRRCQFLRAAGRPSRPRRPPR